MRGGGGGREVLAECRVAQGDGRVERRSLPLPLHTLPAGGGCGDTTHRLLSALGRVSLKVEKKENEVLVEAMQKNKRKRDSWPWS